jgi:hypothetical protein
MDMQHMHAMQANRVNYMTILSLVMTIVALHSSAVTNSVFAESPPLVRQEIQDELHDVIMIDDRNSTITRLTESAVRGSYEKFDSIDIDRVSYFSDGKVLNATIWLRTPGLSHSFLPPENFPLNFGINVDVNPNPAIGVGGVDYHKEVANYLIFDLPINNTENKNSWIEDTHETISYGPHRYLKVSEQNYNYTRVLHLQAEKAYGVYHLPLSLDLTAIASPDKYKVLFYTLSSSSDQNRITDFTSWIDIPPPTFVMSTSPSTIELRPGDSKDIGAILKSTGGSVHRVADYTMLENESGIQVMPEVEKLNRSAIGVEPVSFHLEAPQNIQTGEYAIPIMANVSTGSAIPSEFMGVKRYNSSIPTESFVTTVANLTIRILEPFSPSERFREIWDTYGGFISLVGGGFAAGFSALLFDRLKNRKQNPEKQELKKGAPL